MLRVAIVGCGKIADAHASQIQRIKGCRIVGVCDREPLMARQLWERFPVGKYYTDLGELLAETESDVVHITTPPHTHFDIARACLAAGCHVYVEKPFTVNEDEASKLIAFANQRKLKIAAGHDDQFRHAARRLRSLVQSGFLGSNPIHMESYYCYELSRSGYAGALLADNEHWVRKLPGKLLQNIISHGIARIAEYIESDSPQVVVHGFVSPLLQSIENSDIIDELRVIIADEDRATAYFTFSSRIRPALHQFRIYGERNGLALDQDQETVIKLRGTRLKSYLEKFVTPLDIAEQQLENVVGNAKRFLANDFHMKSGMKYLIEAFYRSIVEGTPVPIPYREILLTTRIMDRIFEQLEHKSPAIASLPLSFQSALRN